MAKTFMLLNTARKRKKAGPRKYWNKKERERDLEKHMWHEMKYILKKNYDKSSIALYRVRRKSENMVTNNTSIYITRTNILLI